MNRYVEGAAWLRANSVNYGNTRSHHVERWCGSGAIESSMLILDRRRALADFLMRHPEPPEIGHLGLTVERQRSKEYWLGLSIEDRRGLNSDKIHWPNHNQKVEISLTWAVKFLRLSSDFYIGVSKGMVENWGHSGYLASYSDGFLDLNELEAFLEFFLFPPAV